MPVFHIMELWKHDRRFMQEMLVVFNIPIVFGIICMKSVKLAPINSHKKGLKDVKRCTCTRVWAW